MTEADWLASDDPGEMLRYLLEVARPRTEEGGGGVPGTSDRKLRLWVAACRQAIAPGRTSWSYDLDNLDYLHKAVSYWSRLDNEDDHPVLRRAVLLREVVGNPFRPVKLPASWLTPDVLALAQAAYDDRDEVSGHLDPVRLLILADSLEEAGCPAEIVCEFCNGRGSFQTSGSYAECPRCLGATGIGTGRVPHPLLAHLRSPGPHVRGCWAIDLILGKE